MLALSSLFSKTRAEIFRLLFEEPAKEAHLRELAREAGLSPAALQRELTSLCHSELILSRRDGNRHYFRANIQHPLYPDIHGLVSKTTGIIPALREALTPVEGIDLSFVFGSAASGNLSSTSDIDVLILGSAGLSKVTAVLRGLSQELAREINPHCLTQGEWHEKLDRNDAFVRRVIDEPKLWLKGDSDILATVGGGRPALPIKLPNN